HTPAVFAATEERASAAQRPSVAVGDRGVVGGLGRRPPAEWAVGFRVPDTAEDFGGSIGAEEIEHRWPLGETVGVDNAARAVAEQRGAGKIPEREAAGAGLRCRAGIVFRDPVAAWLVAPCAHC